MLCRIALRPPEDVPEVTLAEAHRIHSVLMECLETFVDKNRDYNDSWRKSGLLGVLIRLQDKIERAINLSNNGLKARVKTESLEDTLRDAIVYMAMAVILLEEMREARE